MFSLQMLMVALGFFGTALVMHELAHYFVARIMGVKSQFGWSGSNPAVYYSNKELYQLPVRRFFWIAVAPIPFTFFYLFLFMLTATYETFMDHNSLFLCIIFSIGFAIVTTFFGCKNDIIVLLNFRKNKLKMELNING